MTTKNLTDQPKPVSGFGDMWERIMKRYGFYDIRTNERTSILKEKNRLILNDIKCLPYVYNIAEVMHARRQFGIDKYGTALQAFNGRNCLEDLMAEQLDSLVYSEQVLLEHPELAQEMLDWQKSTLKVITLLFSHNEQK